MLSCKNLALATFFRSAVIFVKYRKVSTCTILPNFIDFSTEAALYSRFGGHKGRGEGGEEEAWGFDGRLTCLGENQ